MLTPTFELPRFAQTAARKSVTGYHPRLNARGQELLRAKGRPRGSGVACLRVGYWKLPRFEGLAGRSTGGGAALARCRKPARHAEEIPQGIGMHTREAHEHPRIIAIV